MMLKMIHGSRISMEAHSGSLWINKERALTVAGNRRRSVNPDTINADRDKDRFMPSIHFERPSHQHEPMDVVSSSDKK